MKSLISIIYLQTNSVSGEKLAVGLLGISEKEIFFHVSDQKIKFAAKLSISEVAKLAEYNFQLISNKVQQANKEKKVSLLFKSPSMFNKEYITYLNKYSQGLLQFDVPKAYSGELDKKLFKQLFLQFIGAWQFETDNPERRTSFYASIKKQLKHKTFSERADVDYQLKPEKVKGILLPQDITVISKNGNILAAQAIDFSASIEVISKHTYELEVIFNCLEKLGREKIKQGHKGNYYLLFNQPEKGSEQEKLLNEIKKTKSGLMHIEEAGYLNELECKLEQKNYKPFSEFLQTI